MSKAKVDKVFLQTIKGMCEKEIIFSEDHLEFVQERAINSEVEDFLFDHISNCKDLIECIDNFISAPSHANMAVIDQEDIKFLTKRTKMFNKHKDILSMYHISTDLH